ncbi:MAG: hypothetical protein A3A33_04100 [Candidatus Yanofskybacteria bacterium RIFCSPLOWO2_01_FULL_49_25]|uniref:Uncharacterized protein n=1 Tax=Candidatus Yanofskybacteria bacterium RIFCSPLOWO2_01_FULL_49_25 TaxID=1802701 RepID=A0A1F8GRN9_9BACT|nr:MAG: hypothetical protein A3A33_04100 [Candidatus Yanofskybacteria bacterium RIFCSPLOWO2_01_FULL_49_25]
MISFEHWLVILSACITVVGSSIYIRDTLRGTTKPNRVTWSMWALAPILGTVVALSAHADPWATSRTFLAGFLPLVVFIVSFFNPRAYWKLTFFDLACGFISLIAIILWLTINSSGAALLLLVIADAFACIPTIRKAWHHPETETGTVWLIGIVAVLLVFPSIPVWNIENSAFQIYILIANITLAFSALRKQIFAFFTKTS